MHSARFALLSLALAAATLPCIASAQTLARVAGIFNVFVGLMLTAAILTFATGFAVWLVRLGTWPTYRTEAVKIMEWGVVILFCLIVLLAIVQFFLNHPRAASYIIATIILVLVAAAVIYMAAHSETKKKEE